MVDLLRYEPGIYALDAGYLRPRLAAVYLIVERGRVAVVDTATHACLPRVLAALQVLDLSPASVDYVIPTHVHLDHAGGAGAMMQVFSEARLVVHPRGARHMADPTALFAAVRAVYGEAKANGFDVKALRQVVKLRKQDANERNEQQAVLETYMHALGMLAA